MAAYVYATEISEGRTGSVDYKFQRTYTRVFKVVVDDPTLGPYFVGSCPALPLIYSRHPDDIRAFCVSINPVQDSQDPTLWIVTCQYSYHVDGLGSDPRIDSQQQGIDPASRVDSPLSRPTDYTITTGSRPWAVYQDYQGNSIVNSAGDPFTPPIEIERVEAVITVGFNQANAPSTAWLGSVGRVNSNTMVIGPYTFGIGTIKCNRVSAQPVYENNVGYWRWSLEFGYRPTWAFVLVDSGLRTRLFFGATPRFIIDPVTAQKVDQPVLLDGGGLVLAAGGSPVYRSFDVYPRVAFPTPL
jgi:hypothetical protein